jgi:hypothetical protein
MPHDNPDLDEMLRTVGEFIDEIAPRLDGLDRYHALCARYLVDISRRELGEWRRAPGPDERRLEALLDGPTPPAELAAALCARIRAGDFDTRMDELLDILIAHVTAKVQVSKPSYLGGECE